MHIHTRTEMPIVSAVTSRAVMSEKASGSRFVSARTMGRGAVMALSLVIALMAHALMVERDLMIVLESACMALAVALMVGMTSVKLAFTAGMESVTNLLMVVKPVGNVASMAARDAARVVFIVARTAVLKALMLGRAMVVVASCDAGSENQEMRQEADEEVCDEGSLFCTGSGSHVLCAHARDNSLSSFSIADRQATEICLLLTYSQVFHSS